MKGLVNIQSLQQAKTLEEFILLAGMNFDPNDILPIIESTSIKSARCYFGSKKKNEKFKGLIATQGIEEFSFSEFEYEIDNIT
jgi:hypothetical protein